MATSTLKTVIIKMKGY